MELETIQPATDVDRQLAESKKLTLQPLHQDITPEQLLDTEIAARHVNGPAIANVASDNEDAAIRIQPSQSLINQAKPEQGTISRRHIATSVIALLSICIVSLFFIL